jgi:outer membrane protein OmpA-like peptidoglycan-associated protein
MKTIYITFLVFFTLTLTVSGQEKSRREKQGDKYAFQYAFQKAIDKYVSVKELTPEGKRSLAESYKIIEQNKMAETIYAELIASKVGVIHEDYYSYAAILKSNGKIKESNAIMDQFVQLAHNDLRGKSYLANKETLGTLQSDLGNYTILKLDINDEQSDFGATYYKDKIVYSSNNRTSIVPKRTYNWTGKPFLNLYVSDVKDGQLENPEIFDKNMKSKMHDGLASFSNGGNHMAFTRNNPKDKTKDNIVELQIYTSDFKDEKWSKPESFILNDKGYSVGHPSLMEDGNTMYFVSDMPGGFGGSDIYKITKSGSTWGSPINLGNEVNTEGDELFPFFDEKSSLLFFASDGHFGLGGLDIFVAKVNGDKGTNVKNAGSPINSSEDDFAFITTKELKDGYFSSNRAGGIGNDDIYSTKILIDLTNEKELIGITKSKTETFITYAKVDLYDENNVLISSVVSDEYGAYKFIVESDKNYTLKGNKEDYLEGTTAVNTGGEELIIVADVTLLRKEKEVVIIDIKENDDLAVIVNLNPIYFDFNKSNIRPDAETELLKIVTIMNNHPTMVVKLNAYTDSRASESYNQTLSNKRAESTVEFIKSRITSPSRITGKGFGESNLTNECSGDKDSSVECTEDQHQKNRRSEFIVVKK